MKRWHTQGSQSDSLRSSGNLALARLQLLNLIFLGYVFVLLPRHLMVLGVNSLRPWPNLMKQGFAFFRLL